MPLLEAMGATGRVGMVGGGGVAEESVGSSCCP